MRFALAALLAVAGALVAAPAMADPPSCPPICGDPTPTPVPVQTPAAPQDNPPRHTVHSPIHHPYTGTRGHDRRPCVSAREFRGEKPLSKAETEQRWEVSGLGRYRTIVTIGNAWIYPRCGYDRHEAWYAAIYQDGRLYMALEWKAPNATLHGRP